MLAIFSENFQFFYESSFVIEPVLIFFKSSRMCSDKKERENFKPRRFKDERLMDQPRLPKAA